MQLVRQFKKQNKTRKKNKKQNENIADIERIFIDNSCG